MKRYTLFTLILAGLAVTFVLQAQNLDDDQLMMRDYKLPAAAVEESVLTARDSLMLLNNKPYNGTAYSRYENGKLQHITQFVDGMKHGSLLVWYPDGKPQLISNYRKGRLNGRFKGWYQFGAVIYDLVMKDSKLTGDQMYESDSGPETSTREDSEPSSDPRAETND